MTNSSVTDAAVASQSYQDLSMFRLPRNFRGRSAVLVQIWWLVQSILFHCSPQICFGWRRILLRLFGAKIGRGVLIRPSVRITYPWKLEIGDNAWIGDGVELYTLGVIRIGKNVVISQGSYLCTGTHDYKVKSFPIEAKPIIVEEEAWVASQAFIAPGVHIGRAAVVGARSVVLSSVQAETIVAGHPAEIIGMRNGSKMP
jgi:putative colanic acid biosynthesis acetyltransferase WcaF